MLMKKSFCQDLAVLELERNLMEDWRTKVQEDLLGREGGVCRKFKANWRWKKIIVGLLHSHTHAHTNTHTQTHTHTHTHTHTSHTREHERTHTHIRACTYTNTHAHRH